MKRIVTITIALMMAIAVSAQITLTEGGVYEQKEVINVENAEAQTLYLRALEALSDWTGTEGRSQFGIDHQDKESATVIFKGKDYLGARKFGGLYYWYIYTDFTLKVRCKDGRAQVSVTVPSMYAEFQAGNAKGSIPMRDIVPEYKYKGNMNCKKAILQYVVEVPASVSRIIALMKNRLHQDVEDF